MSASKEAGGGRTDGRLPTPPPSAGVRLEVKLLETEHAVPVAASVEGQAPWTVLVLSAEPDLCLYVRECLRDRTDVRVREAATVEAAVRLATDGSSPLLIVDSRERAIIGALPHLSAILIVDDALAVLPTPRVQLLERPFTAESLSAAVRF